MKRIKFLFILLFVLFLSGCSNSSNENSNSANDEQTEQNNGSNNGDQSNQNNGSTNQDQSEDTNQPDDLEIKNMSLSEFDKLFSYEIDNIDLVITKYKGDLKDVEIPNTVDDKYIVKTISNNAFASTSVENVMLPSSLVTLETGAFVECSNLKAVIFSEGATYGEIVNSKANLNNAIPGDIVHNLSKEDKVNKGCTNVNEKAFDKCPNLELVTISDNIKNIDNNFYEKCDGVNFKSQKSTGYYTVKDGIIYSEFGATLFRNPSGNVNEKIEVLEGVTSIGYMAFWGCNKLKSVTLPKSLETIETGAFSMCPKLEKVEFADGCQLSSLGEYCFASCPKLKELRFPSIEEIPSQCFQESNLEKVIIPATVKKICNNAFTSCLKLESVVFEDNSQLTEIESQAFYQCLNLNEINLPENLTKIGQGAFFECESLRELNIPKNVTLIEEQAFFDGGLTQVTFENDSTCESIGNMAFWGCPICEFTIPASVQTIGVSAFTALEILNLSNVDLSTLSLDASVHVRTSINEAKKYNITNTGFVFVNENNNVSLVRYIGNEAAVVLPDDYEGQEYTIERDCFSYNDTKIKSIFISEGVKELNRLSLWNLNDLESIVVDADNQYYDSTSNSNCVIDSTTNTLIKACKNSYIPDGVTVIGDYAFANVGELKNIYIPASVEKIGMESFLNCTKLEIVEFADESKCNSFGDSVFINCSTLKEIDIPDNVTELNNTFTNCSSLTKISIGANVNVINKPFRGCFGLNEIIIDSNNTAYESVGNCIIDKANSTLIYGYGNIEIPSYVIRIDDFAFNSYNLPLSITIPASVEEIGYHAFTSSNVAIINFEPDSKLKKIEGYGLSAQNLISVTIPASVEVIEEFGLYAYDKLIEVINLSSIDLSSNTQYYFSWVAPKTISSNNESKIELIDNKYYMYEDEYSYYLVACVAENGDVLRLPEKINNKNYSIHKAGIQFYNVNSLIIPEGIILGEYAFFNCNINNIYCEMYTQPFEWASSWNYGIKDAKIYWSNQWNNIDDKPSIYTNMIDNKDKDNYSIVLKDKQVGANSATFSIDYNENINILGITLISNDEEINIAELSNNSFTFDNLLSDTQYFVEIKYSYSINVFGYDLEQVKHGYLKFKTMSMDTPIISIENEAYDGSNLVFDLNCDDDYKLLKVNTIMVYYGENTYEIFYDKSLNHYSIDNIISTTDVVVKIVIKYSYHLNNEKGRIHNTYSKEITYNVE